MKKGILTGLALAAGLFAGLYAKGLTAEAAGLKTIYNSPYVSFSPDRQAWTVNAGDRDICWYQKGTAVSTAIRSSLREPKKGEHLYYREREGAAPVGRWVVAHREGQCIHTDYPAEYHGISYRQHICRKRHYSGWQAYCADCGEIISDIFVYMSREAAETINSIPLGMDHYSLCPFCGNLEQGSTFSHTCRGLSANMYRVVYDPNFPEDAENREGYMTYSLHMYGDAEEYEGKALTPVKRLSRNAYGCTGYRFAGWNRMPDGAGEAYGDGVEIRDLTWENWNGRLDPDGEGTVILYAQWEPAESVLRIDPDGGSYGGRRGITEIKGRYGGTYRPDKALIEPPAGYLVTFQVNGGQKIEPASAGMEFREWSGLPPFSGSFQDGVYRYTAAQGNTDTLRAVYGPGSIVLPLAVREGYSFGGWYYDGEFRLPAGAPGDRVTPGHDLTLYAQWVNLELRAEDNYRAYGGSGAVDLSWKIQDGKGKTYLLYQSLDGRKWRKIYATQDICDEADVHVELKRTGKKETYTVPDTGIYTVKLSGAQGGGYKGFEGGRGGSAEVRVWLEKGEVLTIAVGGSDGYNGGGKGSAYGNGGGCTVLSSDKKGVIAVAGGGGGASESGPGGAGGSFAFLTGTGYAGQDGMAGGGGGFRGGAAGEYTVHIHKPACYREVSGTVTPGADFYRAVVHRDSNVCAETITASAGSARIVAHTQGAQASVSLQVGDRINYMETPYTGTLTFSDTDASGQFDTRGPGSESTLTAVTVFFLHEDGRITQETVWPERLPHTDSIGTEIWYRENSFKEERPVYIQTYAQQRFSGTIETKFDAVCEYPDGVYHGAESSYWMRGSFSFDVAEDVKGVYFEAARSVATWGNGCWISAGVQDVSYRYSSRTLLCGYAEGQVESSLPAYGGGSYVNPEAVLSCSLTPGDRKGDGGAVINAVQLGFQEELKLEDVKAADLAAPWGVPVNSVKLRQAGEKTVSVSWKKPEDRGTAYYHKAEAYPKGETGLLCVSNITQSTLVSGVAGYYYLIDGVENTAVDKSGSYTASEQAEVSLAAGPRYLHLAAADAAGNLSETVHVRIDAAEVPWNIATRQLGIGESENVYKAGDKLYYVRCDGVTPFLLEHSSYMDGQATERNRLAYSIFESLPYGQNIIHMPHGDKPEELLFSAEGAPLLTPYPCSAAGLSGDGRSLELEQMFTLGMEAHGQRLEVIPRAGALFMERGVQKIYYSDPAGDAENGIVLAGDGEGPVVRGLEALWDGQVIDRREESIRLYLTAADDLSGVAEFYLKVTNLDNHNTGVYRGEENRIELEITKDEPLFTGEFTVLAYAVDNVGNVTELSRRVTEFSLETGIERILTPHDPVFKGGESGILHIAAYGYADRVEVEFPPEFAAADERLGKMVLDYTGEQLYSQEIAVQFMVPLYISTDREYTLKVRAFRGDKCLEDNPVLYVTSEGGSILSEFRTRLR